MNWGQLDDAWLHVVAHAKGILAAEKQGRAGIRHERIAAREIVTLSDAVPAWEVPADTGEPISQRTRGFRALAG